jgi:hypothetical protein
MAELALAKPPKGGSKRKAVQWLQPEGRVRVKHLKAKGRYNTLPLSRVLEDKIFPWASAGTVLLIILLDFGLIRVHF